MIDDAIDDIPHATQTEFGLVELSTYAEVQNGVEEKVVTSDLLKDYVDERVVNSTESVRGIIEIATQAEVDNGTDDERVVTPEKLKKYVDDKISDIPDATESEKGISKIATQTEVDNGVNDTAFVTPKKLENRINNKVDRDYIVDKIGNASSSNDGLLTISNFNKLSGIEDGAEENVQSDWNQEDNLADDYIKNKPAVPSDPVQSDWNESDTGDLAYVKNKPSLAPSNAEKNVQSDWDETDNLSDAYIKNKPVGSSAADLARGGLARISFTDSYSNDVVVTKDVDNNAVFIASDNTGGSDPVQIMHDEAFELQALVPGDYKININEGEKIVTLSVSNSMDVETWTPSTYYTQSSTKNFITITKVVSPS
jgi:hypothetical protein